MYLDFAGYRKFVKMRNAVNGMNLTKAKTEKHVKLF